MNSDIRWYQFTATEVGYQLIIEGNITPKDVYHLIREMIVYDRLLITSYDMESSNFQKLLQQLIKFGIPVFMSKEGIEISQEWIDPVFMDFGFGDSQDRFYLLKKNSMLDIISHEIEVDYTTIPDLKLTCKDKSLLIQILNELQTMGR